MTSTLALDKSTPFYVVGGTLHRDAPCYVVREADAQLVAALTAGRFCYVLTSRQMGKSSLMVRVASQLRQEGATVAIVDLTAFGTNQTPAQWYDRILNRIGREWKLEDAFDDFWEAHAHIAPLPRFLAALRDIALPRLPGRLILFLDEIDVVRSLPFSTDELFAAIREVYNRRTEDPDMERLTFCLLGVASPSDLIQDTRLTPFNIGERIALRDFTPDEALPLAQGLARGGDTGRAALARILYWTAG